MALIGQTLVVLGIDVPLYVFIPNLPFELGAGLWLLLRSQPTEHAAQPLGDVSRSWQSRTLRPKSLSEPPTRSEGLAWK